MYCPASWSRPSPAADMRMDRRAESPLGRLRAWRAQLPSGRGQSLCLAKSAAEEKSRAERDANARWQAHLDETLAHTRHRLVARTEQVLHLGLQLERAAEATGEATGTGGAPSADAASQAAVRAASALSLGSVTQTESKNLTTCDRIGCGGRGEDGCFAPPQHGQKGCSLPGGPHLSIERHGDGHLAAHTRHARAHALIQSHDACEGNGR